MTASTSLSVPPHFLELPKAKLRFRLHLMFKPMKSVLLKIIQSWQVPLNNNKIKYSL